MAQQLVHKHSNVNTGSPKAPNSGVLQKGEIAVNYNNADPCLFIEKEDGSIAKFSSAAAIQNFVNNQGFLTEHQELKTINGQTLVGSGNITISGSGGGTAYNGISGVTVDNSNARIGLSSQVIGQSTITSLASIPVTNRLLLANVSSNQTVSFASLPANGFEIHIIIHNTGSSVINITLPSSGNYVCTSSNVIYVAGGLYGEVNLAVIGGKGYIRGISSI